MTIHDPQITAPFADMAAQGRPIPGDLIQEQVVELQRSIRELIAAQYDPQTAVVKLSQLEPDALERILADAKAALALKVDQGAAILASTQQARDDAVDHSTDALAALAATTALAGRVAGVDIDAKQARDEAREAALRSEVEATDVINAANDAEGWATKSQQSAELSGAWAEFLDGDAPIPPSFFAGTAITGNHWSSRWWSIQAAESAESIAGSVQEAKDAADAAEAARDEAQAAAGSASDSADFLDDLYLGAHAAPPTTDNDGDPIQPGAIYYNTTTGTTYVWNGTSWQSLTSAGAIYAQDVIFAPDAATAIASTTVQAAIVEVATERATVTALADEAAARAAADTTLQGHIDAEASARAAADATLQADINTRATAAALNTEITNRIADVDSEEASRIAADNAEASTRAANDATLQTNITNEATARTNADNALNAAKVDRTSSTGAAVIPAGTTAERPSTPVSGYMRYNASTAKFEGFSGSAWGTLGGGAAIADAPPANPAPGDLWWESDTGGLFIRFDDGNSTQWVQVNYVPLVTDYVRKDGDTMSGKLTLNGASPQISLAPASGAAQARIEPAAGGASLILKTAGSYSTTLYLDKGASGQTSSIFGRMNSAQRWNLILGNTAAETGSNAGSNFELGRYDDAGAYIDSPLAIDRSSGALTMGGQINVAPATASAQLTLNKPADTNACPIFGQTNGSNRWRLILGNGTAESGSNVGSDLTLTRYNDSGGLIESLLTIKRSDGIPVFTQQMQARGYQCKPGLAGAYISNIFNINYGTGAQLWIDTTNLGTFTLTSDYRLKKDIAPLASTWEKVRNLRPVSFKWKPFGIFHPDDDREQYGFIAHEIQEDIIPSAAGGEKDEEGVIQNLNIAPIVATLTKALQEAIDRIEALEAAVNV